MYTSYARVYVCFCHIRDNIYVEYVYKFSVDFYGSILLFSCSTLFFTIIRFFNAFECKKMMTCLDCIMCTRERLLQCDNGIVECLFSDPQYPRQNILYIFFDH
jgi:hypothetical protein